MTSDNKLGGGLRDVNLIGQEAGNDDAHTLRKEIVVMEQRVSSALGYRLTVRSYARGFTLFLCVLLF